MICKDVRTIREERAKEALSETEDDALVEMAVTMEAAAKARPRKKKKKEEDSENNNSND